MRIKPLARKAWVTALFMVGAHVVSAQNTVERWHVVSIDGVTVGSNHESVKQHDQQVITRESMQMVLNRLGSRIEMGFATKSTEDPNGELLSVDIAFQSSEQTMKTFAFRDGDQWVTRSAAPVCPTKGVHWHNR